MTPMTRALALFAATAALAACRPSGPAPIAYDSDACAQCRMQISDLRFGAELVTKRGRVVKFDAIECFLDYQKQAAAANDVAQAWVIDFANPGVFIAAKDAWFVAVPDGRSPMGRGLLATASKVDADHVQHTFGGTIKRWGDL